MDRYLKKRFKDQFEPWALAVVCGRIPRNSSSSAASFLLEHQRVEPAVSEVGKLWFEYWDGNPPSAPELREIYLKRALAAQRAAQTYDKILEVI